MADDKNNGNENQKDERIIHFPSLAERDRIRLGKKRQKKEVKNDNQPPLFNFSRIPPLTRIIVAAFLVVHLPLFLLMDSGERLVVFYSFGFTPSVYTDPAQWSWHGYVTPLTHIFIHGGWFHLMMNTTMMLAMGMFTERVFGTRRMLVFFVFSGLAGVLLYFALNPFSPTPVVGASGSISGLFGVTMILLYENGRLGYSKYGVWPFLAFWIFLLTGMGLFGGAIAWQAHLGGFLGGLALFYGLKRGWLRF